MSFQKINGWRVDVSASKSANVSEKVVGKTGKRFTGAMSKTQRSFESEIAEELCFIDQSCADTLEDLFSGEGFFFPFISDAWSVKSGLGPENGSDWTLDDTKGPTATRGHSVLIGASGLIYDAGLIDFSVAPDGGKWTLIYYIFEAGQWVHKVARNDETGFVDGVYSASLAPSEFLVSQGAVAFANGSQIAALSIVPTWVCDDAAIAFYDGGNANGLGAYWRLDQSFIDELGRFNGVPQGVLSSVQGQVKSGLQFSGGSRVEIDPSGGAGADAELSLFNRGAFSIECWVNPSSSGEANSGVIYSKNLAFTLSVSDGSAGKLNLELDVEKSITNGHWILDDALTIGSFSYVCIAFDGQEAFIYVDSNKAASWSLITTPDGVPVDDSGDSPIIGNVAALGRGFDGVLNELRHSVSVLPQSIIKSRWVAGRNRRSVVPPQMMGAFPEVLVSGESVGWGLKSMFPDVKSEDYVAVSIGGERVKARALKVSLSSTTENKASGIPSADFMAVMSQRRRGALGSLVLKGIYSKSWLMSGFNDSDFGNTGAFNYVDRAFNFNGAASMLSSGIGQRFYDKSEVTFMSWVKRGTTFTQNLFLFSDSTGVRAGMHIGNTNEIVMRFRPTAADAVASTTSNPVIDDKWHLIGGVIDLKNNLAKLYIDGKLVSSESIVFAADKFSNEADPADYIGVNDAAANFWTGKIGTVGVWLRELRAGEILTVYEKAKKGFFH